MDAQSTPKRVALTERIRAILAESPGMYTATEFAVRLDESRAKTQLALVMMANTGEIDVERCTCVDGHRRRYGLTAEQLAQLPKRVDRPCLCCGETFSSEGAHNRMCAACRRLSSTTTPFDLD